MLFPPREKKFLFFCKSKVKGEIMKQKIREFMMAGACLMVTLLALSGCGSTTGDSNAGSTSAYPNTDEGARNLINEFVKPNADYAALSKNLRPTKADYEAVFDPDMAKKADALYSPAWDAGQLVVAPKPGQSEVRMDSATTDEMKTWTGAATDFPEGWKQVAAQLKPGVKIYKFKFVEPGKATGMAYEGLAHVNGNWRIFPKPWRVMD
jgi:hypothetical protein